MKTFLVLCVFVAAAFASDEEGNLFEGDIILDPEQMSAMLEQNAKNGNKFAAMNARLWKTNGKTDEIKYYIESSLASESRALKAIDDAVADYHKYTCLRFKRVSSKPSGPHLSFFKDRGCYSYVGRMSRGQQISLGYGCWSKGTAMHEMGHALGFYHEQSRPDRDQYVEILLNNVRSGYENNFNKYTTSRIDSLGSPYDYKSMMHYGSAYFKKASGLITIKTKDPKMQNVIGQRGGFSEQDIVQLNRMYCSQVQPSSGPTQPPQPTTAGPVQTTSPVRTSAPGDCVDKSTKCDSWKIICSSNAYVQKTCPKSCNLCNGPTTAPTVPGCSDISNQRTCDIYKNANLCGTNSYVKKECAKTCQVC